MSDFKSRLIQEKEDLQEKLSKLQSFLGNAKLFHNIEKIQQSLLFVQASAMETYLCCLHERLSNLSDKTYIK